MRYLVSGKQMRQIDADTIEQAGIPSIVLMERAALAVTEIVCQNVIPKDRVLVACGTGNNGADGIAIARMLYLKGIQVTLVFGADPALIGGTGEWIQQKRIADYLNIPMIKIEDLKAGHWDLLIDAVFGVGLSRPLEGKWHFFLRRLSALNPRLVIAVDLPSGIDADQGQMMGIAIKADLTVTFGYQKLGTVLYPGREYSGEVIIADIGIPPDTMMAAKTQTFTYDQSDLCKIPKRQAYTNKGSFGKVLMIAGSKSMSGAAYLSALAAYQMGAGMVKIVTPEENRIILQQLLPEAILEVYDEQGWQTGDLARIKWAESLCNWATVMVVGPGLGQQESAAVLVETFLRLSNIPTVIDADALNVLARNPQLQSLLRTDMIITPHLGEMARLTDRSISWIQQNLLTAAREFSQVHAITCVLKDAVTIVAQADGSTYINSSGNSSMAKAGSGDVLAGMIGGLLALEMALFEAASLGVYFHGCCGDLARVQKGEHGVLARDLVMQSGTLLPVAKEEHHR